MPGGRGTSVASLSLTHYSAALRNMNGECFLMSYAVIIMHFLQYSMSCWLPRSRKSCTFVVSRESVMILILLAHSSNNSSTLFHDT